jgi:hypothetical protein
VRSLSVLLIARRPNTGQRHSVGEGLEADKTAPPKQRHTAKRIFERLRLEHGFAGGYTVVKDYVRIARNGVVTSL